MRNALMGLPASDADVCGPARPETILALCEGTPVRAYARAAHFGTVELHVADAHGERRMAEYTTFRVDSYRCGHRPERIRFADTVEQDAPRRDFSVNALYQPLHGDGLGPVLDPTGGLDCLRRGVLHTVTPDPDQVFKDDGLRILRAARFQAELDLLPTDALLASARRYAPLLREIARERLHDELRKILLSDLRYPTLTRRAHPVRAGLQTISAIGAWDAHFGLPCDEAAIRAQALYSAPGGVSPVSGRLALLLRGATPEALADAMRGLCFSVRETEEAARLLALQKRLESGDCALFDAVRAGENALRHAQAAYQALTDAGTAGEKEKRALTIASAHREALSARPVPRSLSELAIGGNELLPLCRALEAPPCRIGRTLDALWAGTVSGELANEPHELLLAARALLMRREA